MQASSAAGEASDELLEVVQSLGVEQEQVWSLEEGDEFFGWSAVELRSSEWAVALWAEWLLLVAWWEFSEGGGEVELGWRPFWRCGGCFGVSG